MKKIVCSTLSIFMVLCLSACGSTNYSTITQTSSSVQTQVSTQSLQSSTSSAVSAEASSSVSIPNNTENSIIVNDEEITASTPTDTNTSANVNDEETTSPVYTMNDIGSLCGAYSFNENAQTFIGGSKVPYWVTLNGFDKPSQEATVYIDSSPAVTVDRSKGDQVVLAGIGVSTSGQCSMVKLSLLGYANTPMIDSINEFWKYKPSNIAEVNGIDITAVHDDFDATNQAIASTGTYFRTYYKSDVEQEGIWLSTSMNGPISLSYYEGTNFKTINVEAYMPTYCGIHDEWFTAPVQTTKLGYFIIDTSSVPDGLYDLTSVSNGDYIFNLIGG
jgi:hypothetical protein